MLFRDREQAGRLLADVLARSSARADAAVLLALTRGGVPVALQVADALGAPLDVVVVRKVTAPGFPEYALGAVAEGGALWLSGEAIRTAAIPDAKVRALVRRAAADVAVRARRYRGRTGVPARLDGATALLVDDGVATGATARAAARAARLRGASRVLLAAPVIAAVTLEDLHGEVDGIWAVDVPRPFYAVGQWYEVFPKLSDAAVIRALRGESRSDAGLEAAAAP